MSVEEVERAMRGDHDAFAALVGASANRIFALASLILQRLGPSPGRDPGGDRPCLAGAAATARPRTVRGVAAPDGRQRLL